MITRKFSKTTEENVVPGETHLIHTLTVQFSSQLGDDFKLEQFCTNITKYVPIPDPPEKKDEKINLPKYTSTIQLYKSKPDFCSSYI